MAKMKLQDITDLGSALLVQIPDTKTKKPRSFTITGDDYLKLYRKYRALRPEDMNETRFFIKYLNGKCHRQVVGVHKLTGTSQEVANYLNLPDSKLYTGHCLRRTSATLLVNAGGDLTALKRHGGWRSSTVAEGYVDESLSNKLETSKKILDLSTSTDVLSHDTTTNTVLDIHADNAGSSTDALAYNTATTNTVLKNDIASSAPIQFNNCSNCSITINVSHNK